MDIIFMGSPEFALPILRSLAFQHRLLAVYTQPDRPRGRGLVAAASPVKKEALTLGLKVLQPESLKPSAEIASLRQLQPEAIVVAAYGLWLPRPVLDTPPLGCLNVHPSLLPRHRGAAPVAAAILAGDQVTGVSIMLLDEGWDTGPILAQASLPILATDTTGSLTSRLAELGTRLLESTLPQWQRGELRPQPQDPDKATYSQPIKKEAGEIDWARPAPELERRVRALQPWPGCYTWWQGKRLRILHAEVLAGKVAVGQVTERDGEVGVGTGQGLLGLKVVQLEGKKAMDIQDFRRGQRGFLGAILPAGEFRGS